MLQLGSPFRYPVFSSDPYSKPSSFHFFLESCFVMKGIWLPRTYLIFWGACWFNICRFMSQNICNLQVVYKYLFCEQTIKCRPIRIQKIGGVKLSEALYYCCITFSKHAIIFNAIICLPYIRYMRSAPLQT